MERDSLSAFTYYLAQLITGRITCVGGQCVSGLGLCQRLRMEGRKKEKPKPQRDKNLLCLTQFEKKKELAKPQEIWTAWIRSEEIFMNLK